MTDDDARDGDDDARDDDGGGGGGENGYGENGYGALRFLDAGEDEERDERDERDERVGRGATRPVSDETEGETDRQRVKRRERAGRDADVDVSKRSTNGMAKPRKPRMPTKSLEEERVETYVRDMEAYERRLLEFEYKSGVVAKCDETQLSAYVSRLVVRAMQCVVDGDSAHGEYVTKIVCACERSRLDVVGSLRLVLYKEDADYDRVSEDLELLEWCMAGTQSDRSKVGWETYSEQFDQNARLGPHVRWLVSECAKVRGDVSEEDKCRLRRRWSLWLKGFRWCDLKPNVFNHKSLLTFKDFAYTRRYQMSTNSAGVFAGFDRDEINPLTCTYKKLSEMPCDVSAYATVIYDKFDSSATLGYQGIMESIKKLCSLRHVQGVI